MFTVFNEVGKDQQPLVLHRPIMEMMLWQLSRQSCSAMRSRIPLLRSEGVIPDFDCLKAFGQLDYINVINYQNKAGAKT